MKNNHIIVSSYDWKDQERRTIRDPLKKSYCCKNNKEIKKYMQHFLDHSNFGDRVDLDSRRAARARETRNPKLAESQKSTRRAFRVANANWRTSRLIWRGCVTGDYTPSQVATKSCPVRKYLTIPNIGARKRRLLFSFLRPNKSCACVGKRHCFCGCASCG